MKYSKYNVVIIGSGLAGLYLANRLSNNSDMQDGILLITKENVFSGSTSLAQGGIVSVIPEINKSDSIESHIKDTLKAGCGINNLNTVKFVSENSSTVIQELMAMGVEFDKNDKNTLNFTLEGAHSVPRILHAKGDSTGSVIEKVLSDRIYNSENIDIYTDTIAVELMVDNDKNAHGVITFNTNNRCFEAIYSNNIVIATGGIGQIYQNTTNPKTSTGDGIALAHNAGIETDKMEFVQFHPTGLYCNNIDVTPLVSESVRGEGAKLVDINGEYFAKNYHKEADLAPRDVVARSIISQMRKTNSKYVNLDISQIGIEKFRRRFPTITKLCSENDIDISSGLIPVCPVQHYFMGGIKTNINSMTNIKNVFAIGECSMTGLHGANRLASNSLLECAVFAHNLCDYISKNPINPPKIQHENIKNTISKYENINTDCDDIDLVHNLFKQLKLTMSKSAGITRNKKSLENALITICNIENQLNNSRQNFYKSKYELRNAIIVSKLIVKAALNNENSIGAHFRDDLQTNTKNNDYITGNTDNDKLLA